MIYFKVEYGKLLGGNSMSLEKFKGIFPALYACYDDLGEISEERIKKLCNYLYGKRVKGLYVGGSSGECIYQSIEERKAVFKYVAETLKGKLTLIAHVGAPSTRDSIILAQYAEELGYDALSSIPPIYFKLPEESIYKYWTEIIDSTELPFFIYNIPQTTGYSLSIDLFKRLLKNPKVKGIKNSSMPALDIERFKSIGGDDIIVFNGPDEQYISGRLVGADSGIGGTYGVMPELFLMAERFLTTGRIVEARNIQRDINDIIIALCSLNGSMYSVIKEILKLNGVDIGSVRKPLEAVHGQDLDKVKDIKELIDLTISKYEGS